MKNALLSEAIGDIAGSVYEFHATKDYTIVDLSRADSVFTDDTVCTFACAEALLLRKDMAKNLWTRCNQHRNSGYGGRFRSWLRSEELIPYNSYGNGSAMRCSSAGWMANTADECIELATATALPTHNHEEGIKGAVATALVIYHLKEGKDKDYIRNHVLAKFYPSWANLSYDEIQRDYSFDESCQGTVAPAIISFLSSKDYSDCLKLAIALGGDADTLAAIAGPMAYAYYREMPNILIENAKKKLPEWMLRVSEEFDKLYNL
ncbi:MAG: ADP-ribosylglycohydrolase family protein [Muribaculaceae bacterium]|nr:ADP-ribosylglycohydrolase family protein [Muribaculaceae bacterium]